MRPFTEPVILNDVDSASFSEAFEIDPGEALTHYMSERYYRELLSTRMLHLGRLDLQAKDPRDGSAAPVSAHPPALSDLGILARFGLKGGDARKFLCASASDAARGRTYIHCWRRAGDEAREIWERHGEDGRGICIRTSAQRLCDALPGVVSWVGRATGIDGVPLDLEFRGVSYRPDDVPHPAIPAGLTLSRKAAGQDFEKERELRVLATISPDRAARAYEATGREPPLHQKVPVDLGRLFEAVVLGPNVAPEVRSELAASTDKAVGGHVARASALAGW